jgi:hypothetical protein
MKPLTKEQAKKWEKTRRMGRGKYTLIYGMLLWGIPTAILWALAMSAVQGWDRLPLLLVLALVAFPIGGIFFGRLMWKIFETRYAAAVQKPAKKR